MTKKALFRAARVAAATLALCSAAAIAHDATDHGAKKAPYAARSIEEHSFGREGDPKKVSRTILLGMTDAFRFAPAHVNVKRGETVKFIVHNRGRQMHEMVLGTAEELRHHADLMKRFPDMEHADANMTHVKPGARGVILWHFTNPGHYEFACLIPGHFDAGMIGSLDVL